MQLEQKMSTKSVLKKMRFRKTSSHFKLGDDIPNLAPKEEVVQNEKTMTQDTHYCTFGNSGPQSFCLKAV